MLKEHVETLNGIVRAHYRSSGIISSTARHLFFDSFRLGDRGGLCDAQHGLYNWEKPGLHSFYVPCNHVRRKDHC